jgi:hypothetical protein
LPARDRGVGADVSVQPGFVIIMRRKHRVLRYVVLPWTLRMTSAIKCHNKSGMSDRIIQIFGVDKSAEITVNWSMRLGSVSS